MPAINNHPYYYISYGGLHTRPHRDTTSNPRVIIEAQRDFRLDDMMLLADNNGREFRQFIFDWLLHAPNQSCQHYSETLRNYYDILGYTSPNQMNQAFARYIGIRIASHS